MLWLLAAHALFAPENFDLPYTLLLTHSWNLPLPVSTNYSFDLRNSAPSLDAQALT